MATNGDLITEALRNVGVLADGIPLSAEHGSAGLAVMNDMLAEWDADDIDVGWIPQDSTSDDSPIYIDAVGAVKANLAVRLGGVYGANVSQLLFGQAEAGYKRLLRDSVVGQLREADMSHLPSVTDDENIQTG